MYERGVMHGNARNTTGYKGVIALSYCRDILLHIETYDVDRTNKKRQRKACRSTIQAGDDISTNSKGSACVST